MRYLMMVLVFCFSFVAATALVVDNKRADNLQNRSEEEMIQMDGRLFNVHPGDLIVMVKQQQEKLPDMDEVVHSPGSANLMTVKEVSYDGVHLQHIRDVSVSFYSDYHKKEGAIRIIPKERVKDFYSKIMSDAILFSE